MTALPGTSTTVRWEVWRDGQLHDVYEVVTGSWTIRWDRQADIPRIVDGLTVLSDVDFDRDRVRPVWCNGPEETPLGLFLWASGEEVNGRIEDGVLYDRTLELRPPLASTFGASGSAKAAMTELAARARVDVTLPDSDAELSQLAWPAGVRINRVIRQLADKVGWVVHFDRHGELVVRRAKVPGLDPPDVIYSPGDSNMVVHDSFRSGTSLTRRTNVWRVLSVSPTAAPTVGEWRLPADQPGSEAATGVEVVELIEEAGLDQQSADRRAREASRQDRASGTSATMDTVPTPDHDGNMLVEVDGTVWREDGWRLNRTQMQHDLSS